MKIKTSDLIVPEKNWTLSFVFGTKPFLTLGIDSAHRSIFKVLFCFNRGVIVVGFLDRVTYL